MRSDGLFSHSLLNHTTDLKATGTDANGVLYVVAYHCECQRFTYYLCLQTAKLQIAKQNVIDLPEEISYQEEVVDLKHR